MAELLSIEGRTGRGQVRQEIVEVLKEWLAKAESGEFTAIAMVATQQDGTTLMQAPKHDDLPALLGAISLLQFEIMSRAE